MARACALLTKGRKLGPYLIAQTYLSASFPMQAKGRVKKFIDRALATADAFWRHLES